MKSNETKRNATSAGKRVKSGRPASTAEGVRSRPSQPIKSSDQTQQAAVTELIASRLDRTVAALRYALSHVSNGSAEQSRRLRAALRDFAPEDARAIRQALKEERLAQRQASGKPDHDLELRSYP